MKAGWVNHPQAACQLPSSSLWRSLMDERFHVFNKLKQVQLPTILHPDLPGPGFFSTFRYTGITLGRPFTECTRKDPPIKTITECLCIVKKSFLEDTFGINYMWPYQSLQGPWVSISGWSEKSMYEVTSIVPMIDWGWLDWWWICCFRS